MAKRSARLCCAAARAGCVSRRAKNRAEAMMSPAADAPDGCPICDKPGQARFAPFCSRRCADIDLGRWLKGGYAIPGDPAETGDGAPGDGKNPADGGTDEG